MMLGSSGPTFYPKYAICHAVSERFSRTEDFFHLSMPTHIIHVAYAERLGENSAVVQRNFVIDIYWLTPEERDCIQEVYFYQKSEWKKK